MGAWQHTGSPRKKLTVTFTKEGEVDDIINTSKCSDSAVENGKEFVLKRIYYVNKTSNDLKKMYCNLHDCSTGLKTGNTFVQYQFKHEEHEVNAPLPHGNSKTSRPYRRVFKSTREALQVSKSSKNRNPKEVLDNVYRSVGDVTTARSHGQLPRGTGDLYNARSAAKKAIAKSHQAENVNEANAIWQLLEKAKRDEQENPDSAFIRECRIHPDFLVVLASKRQLQDLVRFCTDSREFSIVGVDPTFNIFQENISLTVMTYRNLKLHHSATKKSPVFIGPVLMHQRKDWQTYSRFANTLVSECPALEGIIACGTDGEKALINGLQRNFRFAVFLRCFLHVRDNIKRELDRRSVSSVAKKEILGQIFGKQIDDVKYEGLVDCNNEEEFQTKLESLEERWNFMETECGNSTRGSTFYNWFCKEKATAIKESMLKPIRIEAGLGSPPKEYTNNDPEAANFMIKHGLNFDPKKPDEFVNDMRRIVETQYRNEDRAVFCKGPFEVRPEFQHLVVGENLWSKLNPEEKVSKLEKYQKSGMESKKELLPENSPSLRGQSLSSSPVLSVTASTSGISNIPSSVLATMFDKANELVNKSNHVLPKPGANDGSYVVAGYGNTIRCVTPGKGGSLICDRSCTNFSTAICEHVLAVAHVKGTLTGFLQWYKKSRRGAKLLGMALGSGPKNAGKKPSTRKKSNKAKPPVAEVVDMLADINQVSRTNTPSVSTTAAFSQAPVLTMPHQPLHVLPQPRFPVYPPESFQPVQVDTRRASAAVPQVPGQHAQIPGAFPHAVSGSLPPVQSGPSPSPLVIGPGTSFKLKWLAGTSVSRCYGCNGVIKNPPETIPDGLIVVYRDIRQFRERTTGQLRFTPTPQNVHFHLRAACIRARYPNFPGASALVVPDEFRQYFKFEHIQRLSAEFGWVP